MRAFYSGGNYDNSSYGVASFNGNNGRDNSNDNIGFRAALPRGQILRAHGLGLSAAVIKGSVSSVIYWQKNDMPRHRRSGHPVRRPSGTAFGEDCQDGKALACL